MKDSSFLQYIDVAHVLSGLGNFVAQLDAHPTGGLILVCLALVYFNRRRAPVASPQGAPALIESIDAAPGSGKDE